MTVYVGVTGYQITAFALLNFPASLCSEHAIM